ncbi:MAG: class I SAM-dependent methyltransferase [Bacteroidetes bacterium]|nr:class I SAM-dependent methyltransferase [Bacteroidota bacterium]
MLQFDSEQLKHFISVQDYSLTQEKFELYYSEKYDMLVTYPKPTNEELGKYYDNSDYISHTDSNKSLFEKMYQLVKKNAISSKVTLLNSLRSESKTVLDIGTGTADFLNAMYLNGWSVVGIEPNSKAREIASKKFEKSTIQHQIIFESLMQLQVKDFQKFDVITMWHVLEHVPDVQSYILQLKSMLKPNGTLIIAVPNFKSYDALYYGKFWAAYDVPRHLWHFSKKAIKLLFEKEQMEVIKIFPMKMDSFYVSLLSEKYKTGKMNFFNGFLIGLQSNIKAILSDEYSSHIFIIKNKKIDLN